LGGITAGRWIDFPVYDATCREDGRMNSKTIEILLVEHNPGDARLTREAFKECRLLNNPFGSERRC